MKRLFILFAACIAMLLFAVSASAKPAGIGKPLLVNVPCGFTQLPFFVYDMPHEASVNMTMTFQSSGAGLVTFTAQTWQPGGFYSARTTAACGTCTLVLHNVQIAPTDRMQVAVDASADACPSSGIDIGNFNLQVGPAQAFTR